MREHRLLERSEPPDSTTSAKTVPVRPARMSAGSQPVSARAPGKERREHGSDRRVRQPAVGQVDADQDRAEAVGERPCSLHRKDSVGVGAQSLDRAVYERSADMDDLHRVARASAAARGERGDRNGDCDARHHSDGRSGVEQGVVPASTDRGGAGMRSSSSMTGSTAFSERSARSARSARPGSEPWPR